MEEPTLVSQASPKGVAPSGVGGSNPSSSATKACSTCGVVKELTWENFQPDKRPSTPDFKAQCRKCMNKAKALYFQENKEKIRAQRRRQGQDPEIKRSRKYGKMRWFEDRVQEYLYENRLPPGCECGCGEPVTFNRSTGKPNRFANRAHVLWSRGARERASERQSVMATDFHIRFREKDGSVPIDKFREALRKVKAERDWRWKDVAQCLGISENGVRALMSDKRLKSVRYKTAQRHLRRLAGLPTERTPYEERERMQDVLAGHQIDQEFRAGRLGEPLGEEKRKEYEKHIGNRE